MKKNEGGKLRDLGLESLWELKNIITLKLVISFSFFLENSIFSRITLLVMEMLGIRIEYESNDKIQS